MKAALICGGLATFEPFHLYFVNSSILFHYLFLGTSQFSSESFDLLSHLFLYISLIF